MLTKYFYFLTVILLLNSCKTEKEEVLDVEISTGKYSYKALNTSVDSLQYNNPLLLDLNGDGTIDFYLTSVLIEENDQPYLYLLLNRKTPNLNKALVRQGEELGINGLWGVPLDAGVKIEEDAQAGKIWSADQTKTALLNLSDTGTSKVFGGEWLNKKDKYLGLKFIISGQYHYGWIRISHTQNEAKLAILDYAYNKLPGEPIRAGEK